MSNNELHDKGVLKYTSIYTSFEGGVPTYHIRLTPLETERCRHGIGLNIKSNDLNDIIATAQFVEKYLVEAFNPK